MKLATTMRSQQGERRTNKPLAQQMWNLPVRPTN